jgi:hypothetical protein
MLASEINDSRKDTIVAGVNRWFELADLLGLLLDQSADNRVSIAERSNAEQPRGFARQYGSVSTHEFSRFYRPRSVVHTAHEHHSIIVIKVRDSSTERTSTLLPCVRTVPAIRIAMSRVEPNRLE